MTLCYVLLFYFEFLVFNRHTGEGRYPVAICHWRRL